VSRFWFWDSRCENPVVGVEKRLPYLPQDRRSRSDPDLGASPLDRRLTDFLLLRPVDFSFLSGLSFHLVEFLHQHAFVIELMHMGRSEIKQPLVRPALIVGLDVTAKFLARRLFIGIVPHQIDLFLFHRPIEPLSQRIVGRPSHPGKR
jgi:hypothetical protein